MKNTEYLETIYKNIKMALQSINDMYPKFRDNDLKTLMKNIEERYSEFAKECHALAKKKNIKLKDNNIFSKTMLKTSIAFSTLTDKSSSHIAELFLMGTVRGTITLYKHLKNNKNVDANLLDLSKRLLEFEEKTYEDIKMYLKK